MTKSIMLQGTSSGVGKSVLTMALCRILHQDGYRVAPFKAQNMTDSTVSLPDGKQIAGSQLLQAKAAGASPKVDMNPLVLKLVPGETTHVICRGEYICSASGDAFKPLRKTLLPIILESYHALAMQYDIIVIEGAGSPVELNLTKNDIVNMGIATKTNSPVILVSDIDRGGIFASLYGTVKLLPKEEQAFVKGCIVNRFKGDLSYFAEGKTILEEITEKPLLGIVPHIPLLIPEEDSLYCNPDAVTTDAELEQQFDLLAAHVRESLDMDAIYRIIENSAVTGGVNV